MSQYITHQGTVVAVYPDHITVSINTDTDECQACAIAAMCGKGQKVDVPVKAGVQYTRGQTVVIGAPIGVHRRATVLLLAVPIVLLIGVVAVGTIIGVDTALSSLMATGAVALWYAGLYMLRLRVRERSTFRVMDT